MMESLVLNSTYIYESKGNYFNIFFSGMGKCKLSKIEKKIISKMITSRKLGVF